MHYFSVPDIFWGNVCNLLCIKIPNSKTKYLVVCQHYNLYTILHFSLNSNVLSFRGIIARTIEILIKPTKNCRTGSYCLLLTIEFAMPIQQPRQQLWVPPKYITQCNFLLSTKSFEQGRLSFLI